MQLALDGQLFVRPGANNARRPRIHFHLFRQRMYSRTPAGGPLAGGTRVEIRGEGLNGYGAVIDKINNELIDTNMAERDEKSVWYYRVWPELGLGPWPGKGVGMSEHSSKSAVLLSLKRNVR